jgi:predicted dehydrogenase
MRSWYFERSGPHLIDQAVYLFGFPQSVYADIRTTREHSLVDGLTLYCYRNTSALKSWFFSEKRFGYIHGKKDLS